MSEKKTKYAYKSTLKEAYGLSDSWIKRLGEPDKKVPNPHYGSGPPASLYLSSRVEALIDANREEYDKLQVRRAKMRSAMLEGLEERRRETLEWAATVQVCRVGKLPANTKSLEARIVREHRDYCDFYGRYEDGSDFTLSRNAYVAYLRHNNTNYKELLDALGGRVGAFDAYMIIKDRCNKTAERLLVALVEKAR